jgi:hypothetical protein
MPLRDALTVAAPRALTVRERVGLSAAERRDRATRPPAARRQSQLQNRRLRRYDALPDTLECACGGELRKSRAASRSFVCSECQHRAWIGDAGTPHWRSVPRDTFGHRTAIRADGIPSRVDRRTSRMTPRAIQRLDAELAKRRRITQQLNALAVQAGASSGPAGLPPATSPGRGSEEMSPDEEALLDRAVAPFIAPVPALQEAPTT